MLFVKDLVYKESNPVFIYTSLLDIINKNNYKLVAMFLSSYIHFVDSFEFINFCNNLKNNCEPNQQQIIKLAVSTNFNIRLKITLELLIKKFV